jgi:hypothetical protein
MDRDQYALAVLKHALALVTTVRDEGPDATLAVIEQVTAIPAPPDVDPMVALAVVLAALVPDDRPLAELLAWVSPDWEPLQLAPAPDRVAIVRELKEAGLSDAAIAVQIGVHPRTVFNIRHRNGIPAGPSRGQEVA